MVCRDMTRVIHCKNSFRSFSHGCSSQSNNNIAKTGDDARGPRQATRSVASTPPALKFQSFECRRKHHRSLCVRQGVPDSGDDNGVVPGFPTEGPREFGTFCSSANSSVTVR